MDYIEEDFQQLKSRLEIEQLAWAVSKLSSEDVERLADVLYHFDSGTAMQMMRDISIVDMENYNKYQGQTA